MICHLEGYLLGYKRYDLYLVTIYFVLVIITSKIKLLPERVFTFYVKQSKDETF